jgi:esterase/lipase superfamily enzyme
MTSAIELTAAISTRWDDLAAALGPDREAVEPRLTTLLRALEGATAATEAAAIDAILHLFAAYARASAVLKEALQAASVHRRKFAGTLTAQASRTRYTRVEVLYATDRKLAPGTALSFGADRGTGLTFGEAEVAIPDDHRMGELERPSIWRLEFREDPEKHVVTTAITTHTEAQFLQRAREILARSGTKQVLLFVHGFNVGFDDAVRRTGQFAYDLHFDGPAVLYSWPSEGKVQRYPADVGNTDWSGPRFIEFLSLLRQHVGAEEVHIVAHSMGNRLLVGLFEAMTKQAIALPPTAAPLGQIVFAAPDIDTEVFKTKAAKLQGHAKQYTLYANSGDLALKASKAIQKYPRAGDAGPMGADLLILPPIDTVDATAIDTSFMGHSLYGDNRTVLSDLIKVLREGATPKQRKGLAEMKRFGNTYWQFRT